MNSDSLILNQILPLGTLLPLYSLSLILLELLDKSIGSPLWIIMRNKKEFLGTLCGFDDFVSMKSFNRFIINYVFRYGTN